MVQIAENTGLTLTSSSCKARPGLYPICLALLVGFAFSAMWLSVSLFLICDGHAPKVVWGVMTGLCAVLYCCYMSYIVCRLAIDSQRHYVLELNHSEVVLTVQDRWRRRKSTRMVLLDDIKYAEYYPYQESSSVILHTSYAVMEIPLWPLGAQAQDVVDFLSGRGITVVNVQFDDRISC
jgi:hypothetical protein